MKSWLNDMAKDPPTEDALALPLSALKGSGLRCSCVEGLQQRTAVSDYQRGIKECLERLTIRQRWYEEQGMTVQAATIKAAIRKLRK
mgnify:CR=1 FL=1